MYYVLKQACSISQSLISNDIPICTNKNMTTSYVNQGWFTRTCSVIRGPL